MSPELSEVGSDLGKGGNRWWPLQDSDEGLPSIIWPSPSILVCGVVILPVQSQQRPEAATTMPDCISIRCRRQRPTRAGQACGLNCPLLMQRPSSPWPLCLAYLLHPTTQPTPPTTRCLGLHTSTTATMPATSTLMSQSRLLVTVSMWSKPAATAFAELVTTCKTSAA